jgi:hypothetical protein
MRFALFVLLALALSVLGKKCKCKCCEKSGSNVQGQGTQIMAAYSSTYGAWTGSWTGSSGAIGAHGGTISPKDADGVSEDVLMDIAALYEICRFGKSPDSNGCDYSIVISNNSTEAGMKTDSPSVNAKRTPANLDGHAPNRPIFPRATYNSNETQADISSLPVIDLDYIKIQAQNPNNSSALQVPTPSAHLTIVFYQYSLRCPDREHALAFPIITVVDTSNVQLTSIMSAIISRVDHQVCYQGTRARHK